MNLWSGEFVTLKNKSPHAALEDIDGRCTFNSCMERVPNGWSGIRKAAFAKAFKRLLCTLRWFLVSDRSVWMSNYIPYFYVDVSFYLRPHPDAGLANLCRLKRPQPRLAQLCEQQMSLEYIQLQLCVDIIWFNSILFMWQFWSRLCISTGKYTSWIIFSIVLLNRINAHK